MVFQVYEYGEVVSSEPRFAPSSLNWTPATNTLSVAVADIDTGEPETVCPEVGAVILTEGGVVSDAVLTITVAIAVTEPTTLVAVRV